jgi:hypothetical protein
VSENIELVIRCAGLFVMAVGLGVFLWRKREGAAQLTIWGHSLSVARESLVLFAMGAAILLSPELIGGNEKSQAENDPNLRPTAIDKSAEPITGPIAERVASSETVGPANPSVAANDRKPTGSDTSAVIPAPASAQSTLQQRWFSAVSAGEIAVVEKMLASGAVTIKTPVDDQANTALHLAAERCDAELVKFLLHKGADPDRHNGFSDSPRRIAAVRCKGKGKVLEAFGGS